MYVEKFNSTSNGKLVKILTDRYSKMSYGFVKALIKDKNIKVNQKRALSDINISVGDEVVLYLKNKDVVCSYEEIFEDKNILVLNKFYGIEVVSESGDFDLIAQIKRDKNIDVFAVHRLDRNTQGIVILAKNLLTKNELDIGFKNRIFEKYYLAQVYGILEKKSDKLIAYLKKDERNSLVSISDKKLPGYDRIETQYEVISETTETSILQVKLVTGKTHQIRAHLAHIGHFIIGDDKYGNIKINHKYGKKYQNLISFKLKLHFLKNSPLAYLNEKSFKIDKEKIDFLK